MNYLLLHTHIYLIFLLTLCTPKSFPSARLTSGEKPIIGMLTKPCKEELPDVNCTGMLEARYIRWVEQAGGRVVPLPYEASPEVLAPLLQKINGIFLPGGGNQLVKDGEMSQFAQTGKYIVQWALQQNKQEKYYPVWGTCMGFELLSMIISQDLGVIIHCQDELCENYPTIIEFAKYNSRLFQGFDEELTRVLSEVDINYNWHRWMITQEIWDRDTLLNGFFDLIGYSYSLQHKYKFISAIEGKVYPFYGLQFHPEYNNFDFNMNKEIVHTETSARISQLFGNFLVEECKKNGNHFDEKNEMKYDINQYELIFHHERQLCYIFH